MPTPPPNQANPAEIARIRTLVDDEITRFDPATRAHGLADWNHAILSAFRAALVDPKLVEVNLAGGITDFAYAVTRTDGCYRVLWLPWADVFSLAVESRFGPVDINVHGPAIDCFSSV